MDGDIILAMLGDIQTQLRNLNSNLEDIKSEVSSVNYNTHDNSNIDSKLEDVLTEVKRIRKNTQQ